MFERVCVPPKEPEGTRFDLGLLAESLIFYREVHLILGAPSLQGLLLQLGPDLLLELISEGYLQVRYIDHMLGAITAGKGTGGALYDVGIIRAKGRDLETVARDAFIRATGKTGRGRRLAQRFCQQVQMIGYPEGITKEITHDMQDGEYLEEFIRRRLAGKSLPNIGGDLDQLRYRFSLIPGRGFQLHSNLDLAAICTDAIDTSELHDPARVLAHYGTTVADMSLCAQLQADAAVTPKQADVLTARVDKMLAKTMATAERVSTFQEFVFDDARAIREAVNTGRDFRELLPVLAKVRRFSEWLSNQPPEINLVKAYHKEVIANTWIDKLPGKTARWVFFTGVGIGVDSLGGGGIGIATGLALRALDSFLLDKIIKGWKPHHFVEGTLKGFLKKNKKN